MNTALATLQNSSIGQVSQVAELNRWEPDLYREHLEHGVPCVLRGAASHWPAMKLWGADYFRDQVGGKSIYVKTYDPVARHKTPRMVRMTVSEFLDTQSGAGAARCRIGDVPIEDFLPDLLRDVETPPLVTHSWFRTGLFVGQNSFCAMHYHTHDEAVLVQVTGSKTVVLYPPRESRNVYPVPWYIPFSNWSRVNIEHPDPEKFPRFRTAAMLQATLQPGDMLFIPIHWWHATFGGGFSTSLTYFWLAHPKRWAYPTPGLRVLLSPYNVLIPLFLLARRLRGRISRRTERHAAGMTGGGTRVGH